MQAEEITSQSLVSAIELQSSLAACVEYCILRDR